MLQLIPMGAKRKEAEALAIPVCEDQAIHINKAVAAAAEQAKKLSEFKGKKGDFVVLYDLKDLKAKRTLFCGVGKMEDLEPETFRAMAGRAVKEGIKMGISELLLAVPDPKDVVVNRLPLLEAMAEGACLANHLFDSYKKEKKLKILKKIRFMVNPNGTKEQRGLLRRVETVCRGTLLARDWVSMPPNDKRPEQFSKLIAAEARKASLKVSVLDETRLKQRKMEALLAVAAGSRSKPRLVVLEYGSRYAKKTVAFVGKGVTFDSGGINLKPSGSLEDMKSDMSGAAAVAAAMIAIAGLKPKIRVIGAIPIVENMPSGSATRPGDIVKSFEGKTIEIGNTDAEGRLILVDAMSYIIKRYKPRALIDLATLTGACIIALGEKIAGVFSPDDGLAGAIVASGIKTHERCWRLPLPEDYKSLLKSEFADIKNISETRWGGAITAALFMAEFVRDTRWAHIDIAGPAYIKKENEYCSAGGTGFGVRLLCDLLEEL